MKIGTRFRAMRLAGAAAIVAALVYAGAANKRNLAAVSGVERTLALGRNLERLTVAILDEESSVRAYHISGNPKFIENLDSSRAIYDSALKEIRELSRNHPSQAARSERLARVGAEKLAWMKALVDLFAQGKHDEATTRVRSAHGEALMREIEQLVSAMNDEERDRLRAQESDAARARTQTDLGIAALCALLLASYLTIRKQSKSLVRAASEIADSERR